MTAATALPPLPRWFVLLPLIAVATWWPWSPYWKSDDYLMLHHANDLSRVVADFVGPQYGATDIWFFWRPLMTASFWLELQLAGGPSPLLSHATNVLVHAGSALLVALLWRRWIGDVRGFVAGLLWAVMPSHQGAITWAVGRSDVHGTFWSLLAILLACRRVERRTSWWPVLVATGAALLTKEIAFVVPAIVTLLALFRERDVATALRTTWQPWLLFGVYLALRFAALGRLGGYGAVQIEPWSMFVGLLHVVADLLVPLRWSDGQIDGSMQLLAALPVAVAIACCLTTPSRRRLLAGGAALFVVACVPMAPFFTSFENTHNLRYYCLPTVALVGLFALPGREAIVPVLLVGAWIPSLVHVRTAVHDADRQARAQHEALLGIAKQNVAEPMFVADLPVAHPTGQAVMFHFGVDRALSPPFTERVHRLLPLRPLGSPPFVFPFEVEAALPDGSSWRFTRQLDLVQVTNESPLPDLPIRGDGTGVVDLTTPRLEAMHAARHGTRLELGTSRADRYRVTIFTALGSFACDVQDHAADADAHGTIDWLAFLGGDEALGVAREQSRIAPAKYGAGADHYAMLALTLPTTHDLVPEFPVLIEAGSRQPDGTFVATHRAQRLLTLRFDRGYPAWVRRYLRT